MGEQDSDGRPAGKDGDGAQRAPPEAEPLPPGIPEPETSEAPAPASLPVGEPPEAPAGKAGPGTAGEPEGRLDHRLEMDLDREVERGTEERLKGEIDQGIERRLRERLELQLDAGTGRRTGPPAEPRVVDLGARSEGPAEEVPFGTVLPPGGAEALAPPGPGAEPPTKKKVTRRTLRNREPPERQPAGNGRPAGLVNGRGLRNRRGFANGMINGEGAVNGRGAVNGLRNRRGMSNGNGMADGNGLVNGRLGGRTGRRAGANGGLTDAEGATNGRGMVNGRGIVNGEGITNGRRLAIGEAPPRPRRSTLTVFAVAVVVVMLIMVGIYFSVISTEKGIHVDGLFSDWEGVAKGGDDIADAANPEINIVNYALAVDGSSVYLYLRTEGKALGGRNGGVDSVFWFFDTDQDAATGYRIDSVGAELVLIVDGYEGRVSAAGLYKFPRDGARPANDWNSRTATGACRAASAGSELEGQTALSDLGAGTDPRFNLLVYTKDDTGGEDYAPVLSTEKVRLTAYWSRVGPARTDPGASGVPLLEVELVSAGGIALVSALTVHASGALADGDISRLSVRTAAGFELPGAAGTLGAGRALLTFSPPLAVAPGSTVAITVLGTFSTAAVTGKAVGLSLDGGRDLNAGTRAITVEAREQPLTYIGPASGHITIDGAFQDWEGCPDHPDPKGDTADPGIDVTGFRAVRDAGSLFVYLRVDGEMMGGMGIPEHKLRPPVHQGGGNGAPVSLPVLVGEDSAFVFIDADNDSSTGYSGGGLPLGADFLANFTGQYGRISTRGLHRFTGGDRTAWSWSAAGGAEAATDATRLEAALALSDLGTTSANISLFYYLTNWRLDRDAGERIVLDLAAGTGGRTAGDDGPAEGAPEPPVSGRDIQPLHAPEFQEVLLPVAGMAVLFFVFRRRSRGARR